MNTTKQKYIVVERSMTYDVQQIKSEWAEMNNGEIPTDDEVMEIVMEWAQDDLSERAYGGSYTVTWRDENGKEIV